jgi:inner membrane protein
MSNVRAHRVPTVLSHPAVPLALGLAFGSGIVSKRLLLVGVVASVLPDLDVIAFRLGIGYSHELGHRGFSHSLIAALFFGSLAAAFAKHLLATRKTAFLFVFVAAASHGLLDMLTNGGLGIALAWPFSDQRYFFPWQVVEASPLSLRRVFGPAGLAVIKSELLWVWLPAVAVGLALFGARRKNAL